MNLKKLTDRALNQEKLKNLTFSYSAKTYHLVNTLLGSLPGPWEGPVEVRTPVA